MRKTSRRSSPRFSPRRAFPFTSRFRRRSLSSPDVWNVAPAEGIEIQKRLRALVRRSWDGRAIRARRGSRRAFPLEGHGAGSSRHPRIPRLRDRRFERLRGALRVSVRPRAPFVPGDSRPPRGVAGAPHDPRLHSLRRSGNRASPRARAREPPRARSSEFPRSAAPNPPSSAGSRNRDRIAATKLPSRIRRAGRSARCSEPATARDRSTYRWGTS